MSLFVCSLIYSQTVQSKPSKSDIDIYLNPRDGFSMKFCFLPNEKDSGVISILKKN